MEMFDVMVVGGGSGLNVAAAASDRKMSVALVEEGPMGGTCLNRGCIPSKILIHSADVAETIRNSSIFGVRSTLTGIDFARVMKRARVVDKDAANIEDAIKEDRYTTLFKKHGVFVGDKTIQIGNKKIKAKKIIIGAGTRPRIPPVEGINDVSYITSKEALRLKKLPKTMTVIGGGYIAAELAHFYGALGTKTTVIQRSDVMVTNEDRKIAEAFTKSFSKNHKVMLGYSAHKVEKKGGKIITTIVPKQGGRPKKIVGDTLLVAAGRVSNADRLGVGKTGVDVNKYGYIVTNDYLETSAKNIWAFGDIAGKYFFKHSANVEASVCTQNAIFGKKVKPNYTAMPHAIFSSPQVAGVGETQAQLDGRKADYATGEHKYSSTGMGLALAETDGFVRVYVDRKTKKILGAHMIGPDASTAIHEVIIAMRHGITADKLFSTIHIHPALSEVVQRAFGRLI